MSTEPNTENQTENIPTEANADASNQAATVADQSTDTPSSSTPPPATPSKLSAMLDKISTPEAIVASKEQAEKEQAQRTRDASGKFAKTPVAQITQTPFSTPSTPSKTTDQKDVQPKIYPAEDDLKQRLQGITDPEDIELMQEIKSPRAVERVKKVLGERKMLAEQLQSVQSLVATTGANTTQVAEAFELLRLANSASVEDARSLVKSLDNIRAQVAQRAGVPAGEDPLSGFDDLKKDVQEMNITSEHAVEIANLRRERAALQLQEQIKTRQQQAYQESLQQQTHLSQVDQQRQHAVESAQAQITQYFESKKGQVDHEARMVEVSKIFSDQNRISEFAATYEPHQWLHVLRMVYETVRVAPIAQNAMATPISARSLGGMIGVSQKSNTPTAAERAFARLGL